MAKEIINIPPIVLEWSDWIPWDDVKADARNGGVEVPNGVPGVYEAKCRGSEERLTIGETDDLRRRIKEHLVRGKGRHSSGERIRAQEDISKIVVRWAITDRRAVAQAALHERHVERFGRLPKYVKRT